MTREETGCMDAYESQLLLTLAHVLENSPYINVSQKRAIEYRLQEIIEIYNKRDYV